jgi:hypothetical protein
MDELGGDEVAVASHWCRAGANFADRKVGGDAVFRQIDENRAADGERFGRDSGQTKVAVSLRRDEPLIFRRQYSMQTALCERVVRVDGPDGCRRGTTRLVSAERDGYIG